MTTSASPVLEALQAFDRGALRAALRKGEEVPVLWSPGLPLINGLVREGLKRLDPSASDASSLPENFSGRLASLVGVLLEHSPWLDLVATHSPHGSSSKVTALLAAAQANQAALLEVLARHGANVDASTPLGATAAHWAAARGNVRMMRRLAERHANLDKVDEQGRTPAHWAARQGEVLMLRELKRLGAECTQPDLKHETPADRLALLDDGKALQLAWLAWLGLHAAKARARALSSMLPSTQSPEHLQSSKPPKTRF